MTTLLPNLLILVFLCLSALIVDAQDLPRTRQPSIGVHFSADGYSVSGSVFSHEDRDMVLGEIAKYLKRPPSEVEINRDFSVADLWPSWKADFKLSLANAAGRRSGLIVITPNVVRSADELSRLLAKAKVETVEDCTVEPLINPSSKKTLIILFATWCPPCQKQLSNLNDTYKASTRDGLEIVALQADNESRADVKAMVDELGLTFRVATPDGNVINNMMAFSEFGGIPQALLYSNGRILNVFRGGSDSETSKIRTAVTAAISSR